MAFALPPPRGAPSQHAAQRWKPALRRAVLVGSSAAAVCATRVGRCTARSAAAAPADVATASASDDGTRLDYWAQLWTEGKLGFHRSEVHDGLLAHWPALAGDDKAHTVLVPLCGKTLDLAWLAQQAAVRQVVGVEFVKQAVDDFSKEHPECKLRVAKAVGPYSYVLSDAKSRLSLWCGDIFLLPADRRFSVVWDRASLIALVPALRAKYVQSVSGALAPGGRILLRTLERAAGTEVAKKAGPPYSVSDAQVHALYGGLYDIKLLDVKEMIDDYPRFRESGLKSVIERSYLLTKKTAEAQTSSAKK